MRASGTATRLTPAGFGRVAQTLADAAFVEHEDAYTLAWRRALRLLTRQLRDAFLSTGGLYAAGEPPPWHLPRANELHDRLDTQAALVGVRKVKVRVATGQVQGLAAGLGVNFDLAQPMIEDVIAGQSGRHITHVTDEWTREAMGSLEQSYQDGLSIPNAARAMTSRLNSLSSLRARTIARTELAGVTNGSTLAMAQEFGVAANKQWIATDDDRTRDSHAAISGEIVAIDQPFSNQCMYPGDPNGDPEEVINCRCTLDFTDEPAQGGTGEAFGGGGGEGATGAAFDTSGYTDILSLVAGPYADSVANAAVLEQEIAPGFTGDPQAIEALHGYQLGGNDAINGLLRGQDIGLGDVDKVSAKQMKSLIESDIAHIDHAMEKSRTVQKTITYRSVPMDVAKDFKVGDQFVDKGFSSTTWDLDQAAEMQEDADIFKVYVPEGTRAINMNATVPGQSYKHEQELVLARGTRFEIVERDEWGTWGLRVVDQNGYVSTGMQTPEEKAAAKLASVPNVPRDNYIAIDPTAPFANPKMQSIWQAKRIAPVPKVTLDEAQALQEYQSGVAMPLNDALRGLPPNPEWDSLTLADVQGHVDALDAMMSRSSFSQPTIVYRGVPAHMPHSGFDVSKLSVGSEWVDEGFSSTSFSHDLASSMGERTLQIRVPAGTRAISMDSTLEAAGQEYFNAGEREVVLDRGTRFRVIGHSPDGMIQVEVVEQRAAPTVSDVAKETAAAVKQKLAPSKWDFSNAPYGTKNADPANLVGFSANVDDVNMFVSDTYLKHTPGFYESPEGIAKALQKQEDILRARLKNLSTVERKKLKTVALVGGQPPKGLYPNLTNVGATGGSNGQITYYSSRLSVDELGTWWHELGHVVGEAAGPVDVEEWQAAQVRDLEWHHKLEVDDHWLGLAHPDVVTHNSDLYVHHNVTVLSTAVSKYGATAVKEDWAESYRLWRMSEGKRIATVSGHDYTFAELYPERASIFADEFGAGVAPVSVKAKVPIVKVTKAEKNAVRDAHIAQRAAAGDSLDTIATEHKLSTARVKQILAKAHVKIVKPPKPPVVKTAKAERNLARDAHIAERAQAGDSLEQIATDHKLSTARVKQILAKAHVKVVKTVSVKEAKSAVAKVTANAQRDADICARRIAGATMRDLSDSTGLSIPRLRQILSAGGATNKQIAEKAAAKIVSDRELWQDPVESYSVASYVRSNGQEAWRAIRQDENLRQAVRTWQSMDAEDINVALRHDIPLSNAMADPNFGGDQTLSDRFATKYADQLERIGEAQIDVDKAQAAYDHMVAVNEERVANDLPREGYGEHDAKVQLDTAKETLQGNLDALGAPTVQAFEDNIRAAFQAAKPLDRPINVTRGLTLSEDTRATWVPGKVITDKGFMATAMAPFANFGGNVKLHLTVPKGFKGISVYDVTNRYPNESEYVLPPGTRFEIYRDDWAGGARVIYARVLP